MSVLSVKVPESLDDQVAEYARRHGVSKSSVVREALRSHLARETETRPRSFLEQAKDLAGIVEAESDLSTNLEHLESYGR